MTGLVSHGTVVLASHAVMPTAETHHWDRPPPEGLKSVPVVFKQEAGMHPGQGASPDF